MNRDNAAIQSLSFAIVGSGGAGVMTAGQMLLDAAARAGLCGLMSRSSGPQIRGGEAAALLRLASTQVESHGDRFDVLLAVDWQNAHRFASEIPIDARSFVVGDPAEGAVPEAFSAAGARIVPVPLKAIAKKVPGGRPNMVALGALGALAGIGAETLARAIEATLQKGGEALKSSLAAMQAGMAAVAEAGVSLPRLAAGQAAGRWTITGNEATGLGAVRGGVRFVAAYPITPATEILEWLSSALPRVGGTLVQAEDELASINMAIGASYGGVPSLTATSGPGLSLMTEALGLAVAAEIPLVVVDVMRGGPSTGIPTKSEQADLNIALYGLHGDAPHVVVAPNSIADCLPATQWAVHLAETLQVPALVLPDQSMGQSRIVLERPASLPLAGARLVAEPETANYRRYALTPSGISPMARPGTRGTAYTADGLEHSERGIPSSQAGDHLAQLDKRARKLDHADYSRYWAEIEGEGDVAVVTWGSCTAPVREALARARAEGVKARLVSLRLLAPAQPERLAAALAGVRRILVVEQTHSGQFHRYLRAAFDLPCETRVFHRAGPLPMRPGEIHSKIVKELAA
ncbi:MAG: 2-oxoacid:acceptor oxidoreductase subunit alpha [Candidatus Odyssella sp.]|nr:2-oxoacid:acceptor oxidoreductase subunit alpha [Candidatus Odyssella sp.]